MKPRSQLYHADGREAQYGDEVTDFRGDKSILMGWPTDGGPKHLGKSNKVWVRNEGDMYEMEYYPSVFNLTWEKPE